VCNRFRLTHARRFLAEQFQAWDEIEEGPRYNIAPTQQISAIREHQGKRQIFNMRWGLMPAVSSRPGVGHFNARSESVTNTPAFRDLVKDHRCLIPADGFYEWRKMGSVKQPFCFEVGEGELFAFAGLWEDDNSCVILTTEANSLVAEIHDRMPVIVRPEDYEVWLKSPNLEEALATLTPYDPALMRSYPVNPKLNNSKNDDAASAFPIKLEPGVQTELF
jgi:putative SOS response-associated peptidase YedK